MTVCIAAIADAQTQLPKIVFCADRLVSAGIQFEHGVPKIQALSDYCHVMVASNDSLRSDMIIKNVKSQLVGRKLTIREIVDLFARECEGMKKQKMERDVLFPLGMTYGSFIQNSESLAPDLLELITNTLLNYRYEFESEFLVIGLEPEPHIYVVDQNGNYRLHDFMGFATIGSGSSLAFSEMTKYMYHPNVPWTWALVRVYNSKKVAERIGGVGPSTDLYVLHIVETESKAKIVAFWELERGVKELLDEGIRTMKENELNTYADILSKIQKFFNKAQEGQTQAKPEEHKEAKQT